MRQVRNPHLLPQAHEEGYEEADELQVGQVPAQLHLATQVFPHQPRVSGQSLLQPLVRAQLYHVLGQPDHTGQEVSPLEGEQVLMLSDGGQVGGDLQQDVFCKLREKFLLLGVVGVVGWVDVICIFVIYALITRVV